MRAHRLVSSLAPLLIGSVVVLSMASCGDEDSEAPPVVVRSIGITPQDGTAAVGDTVRFLATTTYSNGDTDDSIEVDWSLLGDPVGLLDRARGPSANLIIRSTGVGLVFAELGSVSDSASLHCVWGSPLLVLNDNGPIGYLGLYHGDRDGIEVSFVPDAAAPEGDLALAAQYAVSTSGWAGLYVEAGAVGRDMVMDLRDFLGTGFLRLWIKSTVDVQIGIRAGNVTPGAELSKVWSCSGGYAPCDGAWHEISIPLQSLKDLHRSSDFGQMEVLLSASIVGAQTGSVQGTFWIDNVRWTKD